MFFPNSEALLQESPSKGTKTHILMTRGIAPQENSPSEDVQEHWDGRKEDDRHAPNEST